MAAPTSKRKRDTDDDKSPDRSEDDEGVLRARFQRAFEAKFKPLAVPDRSPQFERVEDVNEDEEDSDDSEWDGISDGEEYVEVIEHDAVLPSDMQDVAVDKKTFMSSKPPAAANDRLGTKLLKVSKPDTSTDEPQEAQNLKHDLALQRLLKESHLLSPTTFTSSPSSSEGKTRRKALDLRLKDLGAKESISAQENMPLSHRRGISAKMASREEKRRREAAENGVVLERATGAVVKGGKQRERGVGGAAVGRFRGGTLMLGERDLKAVQGGGRKGFGRGKVGRG